MVQNEFQGISLPRDDSEPHLLVFHDTIESNIYFSEGHNRGRNTGESPKILLP